MANSTSVKNELKKQSGNTVSANKNPKTLQGWIRLYEGQIAKALPSVMTPERFSRMALTAITRTPKLSECSPESFVGAMLTAAQLGLEPNTPLGQAYLIPYKGDCQFQIGYKGLIDLAYRSGQIKRIAAEVVYENDEFSFEYGLNPELKHKPAAVDRGEPKWVYAVYELTGGGYSFKVMGWDTVIEHGKKYSKTYGNGPWLTAPEEMAKKTVLKQLLKYAPLKSEFVRGVAYDEKSLEFNTAADETDSIVIPGEAVEISQPEPETGVKGPKTDIKVDEETGEITDFAGTPFEEV